MYYNIHYIIIYYNIYIIYNFIYTLYIIICYIIYIHYITLYTLYIIIYYIVLSSALVSVYIILLIMPMRFNLATTLILTMGTIRGFKGNKD